jgi:hypothetical protein
MELIVVRAIICLLNAYHMQVRNGMHYNIHIIYILHDIYYVKLSTTFQSRNYYIENQTQRSCLMA